MLVEDVIESPACPASSGHGDMLGGRNTRQRGPSRGQRVPGRDHAHEPLLVERLDLDFVSEVGNDAYVEIDEPVAKRGEVFFSFGHETEDHLWRVPPSGGDQTGSQDADQGVVDPDGEGSLQRCEVNVASGLYEGVSLFDQLMESLLDGESPGSGDEAAPGAHEDGVAEGLADPPEGAAGGRDGEVEAFCGGGDAAFGQEHVQGQEQIPVDRLRHTQ